MENEQWTFEEFKDDFNACYTSFTLALATHFKVDQEEVLDMLDCKDCYNDILNSIINLVQLKDEE